MSTRDTSVLSLELTLRSSYSHFSHHTPNGECLAANISLLHAWTLDVSLEFFVCWAYSVDKNCELQQKTQLETFTQQHTTHSEYLLCECRIGNSQFFFWCLLRPHPTFSNILSVKFEIWFDANLRPHLGISKVFLFHQWKHRRIRADLCVGCGIIFEFLIFLTPQSRLDRIGCNVCKITTNTHFNVWWLRKWENLARKRDENESWKHHRIALGCVRVEVWWDEKKIHSNTYELAFNLTWGSFFLAPFKQP